MTLLDVSVAFDQWNPRTLIGLPLLAAQLEATDHGWITRVVSVDGESCAVTRDINLRRINLTVVNEVVSEITEG